MSTPPAVAAVTTLILEIFQLNGRLLAAGDRLVAPLGLTSARWQVLGAIDAGPLPVSAIARAMGLARQSVQRTVDLLIRDGLVETRPNPGHKRAYLVALTPLGRDRLDTVTALQREWAAELTAGMDAACLARGGDLLKALRRRLEVAGEEGGGP
jgi:DNA-binding MarR family transcriptional regulator